LNRPRPSFRSQSSLSSPFYGAYDSPALISLAARRLSLELRVSG
jgi:hypothetical protein